MSSEPVQIENNQDNMCTVSMESVHRIAKLPVVESTIQTATNIYGKVKDYNSMTNWTLQTAENTVYKAVEVGKPIAAPVVTKLEGPIKRVDDLLCSGLDYVEAKVPSVKLPPGEIYNTTKEYVSSTVTPVVNTACAYAKPAIDTALHVVDPAIATAKHMMEPTVKTVRDIVEPAVEIAKTAVEPAVQTVRDIVEPYVQPAVDKAYEIKNYGSQKVDEFLHPHQEESSDPEGLECQECQDVGEKKKEETRE